MARIRWREVLRAIEPYPRENFKVKAVALGLAMLLWLGINSEEPAVQQFTGIPIELVNRPPDLVEAEEWQNTVDVLVRGPERIIRDLSAAQIRPRIDISDAHRGDNILILTSDQFTKPFGVEVDRINPSEIRLRLEQRVEASVPIAAVTQGEPAEGYEVVAKTLEPPRARVVGPASRVEQLQNVVTTVVDVSGLRDSTTQRVSLRTEDNLVTLASDRTAQLTVEIREIPVRAEYERIEVEVVNAQYRVAVNPERLGVTVSGPPTALENLTAADMRAVIDVAELEPRPEDYLIEPTLTFVPPELGTQIDLVAFSQARINVRIFPESPQ